MRCAFHSQQIWKEFHSSGLWNIAKWQKTNAKKPEDKRPKKVTKVVKKEVKGEKNGKTRMVRVNKMVI